MSISGLLTGADTYASFEAPPRWPRRALILLVILTCTLALPTSVTPVGDDDGVILDVGQHVVVSEQNWALGITLILFGLVEVFYGFKFIRLTLFITGFLSWAVLAMVVMVAIRWDLVYTTFLPQYYYMWVWLSAGLTGAVLSFRYWDLGVTFIGAFGGFALAMGIVAVANLSIGNAGRYVILGLLILGGAALATFFERVFIICATSFGGAYVFMFGVDQFAQVGYREMIVIFDFTGKTLTYHPNIDVYLMLGFSLLLAALGVAWEFWHHEKPLLVDRRALFRIYGRPFGKRPRKLVGQRIHHHLKTKSEVYAYVIGCFCLQKWSIDDVLEDDTSYPEIGHPVSDQSPISTHQPANKPEEPDDYNAKEPKAAALSDGSVPQKSTSIDDHDEKQAGLSDNAPLKAVADEGKHGDSITAVTQHSESSGSSGSIPHADHQETRTIHGTREHSAHSVSTYTETFSVPIYDSDASPFAHVARPQHPLFSPNLGARTMEMLRLVTEDISPGNTIPRAFLSENNRALAVASASSAWPISRSSSDARSSTSLVGSHGLHMLEVSESTEASLESQESEGSRGSRRASSTGG